MKNDVLNRSIMWTREDEIGLEHLRLFERKNEITADGMALLFVKDAPVRVHYTVRCNTNWHATLAFVHVGGLTNVQETLTSDGAGHWSRAGKPLPELDGCMDVDINITPTTNTLPIRRLALKPGQLAEIKAVYFSVPDLSFHPAQQVYTCLDLTPEGGLYRYENLATDFTADITVDADGVVIDYPDIWRRV